jgi:hypothetical protein
MNDDTLLAVISGELGIQTPLSPAAERAIDSYAFIFCHITGDTAPPLEAVKAKARQTFSAMPADMIADTVLISLTTMIQAWLADDELCATSRSFAKLPRNRRLAILSDCIADSHCQRNKSVQRKLQRRWWHGIAGYLGLM